MASDLEEGEDRPDEAEREVLLAFYGFVREEIVSESALHNKRIIQGLAVIGAILGYGVLRDSVWVVAITPFVLGAIVLQTAISVFVVAKDARQLIEIESRLQSITDVATWETKYGGYYGVRSGGTGSFFDLDRIPALSLLILAVVFYILLARFSLIFWNTSPEELHVVTTGHLLDAYVIFGCVVGGTGLLSLRYFLRMNPHRGEDGEEDSLTNPTRSEESLDDDT